MEPKSWIILRMTIWIWLENRLPRNAPYYLITCVNTNFFCSKNHLDKWLDEETMERSGKAYSLDEAFAAREDWCTYKMYKLVTEGRPWGVRPSTRFKFAETWIC